MDQSSIDRRTLLKTGVALAVTAISPKPLFAQQQKAALPARGEFVIRNAIILSMDARIGDLPRGDVHVRDGAIVAIAKEIAAPAATSIDATNMICMPGFIDTHVHFWTSALRAVIRMDDPKLGYFPVTNRLGPLYTPEDSYRNVRLGVAEALAAGATTVHNWAHNVRSAEHADAELRAMRDVGVRGRFSYGPAQSMPNDQPMDFDAIARIVRQWLPNDGTLTLGINSRNVGDDPNPLRGNIPIDLVKLEWSSARKLGLPITLHTSGPSPIKYLEDNGLLGPDVQFVHPLLTTAEERKILHARGCSYSTSPVGESRRAAAAGEIQFGELLEAGVKVSLSTDNSSSYPFDYFNAMRMLYNLHQHRIGARIPLTSRRLVQLATLDGAIDLGIAERTGSLTPGKRADIILVRTTDINVAPSADPYEALVGFGQTRNVDTVVVDGRILVRGNRFTALDHAQVMKEANQAVASLRARAGWP